MIQYLSNTNQHEHLRYTINTPIDIKTTIQYFLNTDQHEHNELVIICQPTRAFLLYISKHDYKVQYL